MRPSSAEIAAVVMHEGSHLLLVTPFATTSKSKIQVAVPRKRPDHRADIDKGMLKFRDYFGRHCATCKLRRSEVLSGSSSRLLKG